MFNLFKKKHSSHPTHDDSHSPIPGPNTDDFVHVNSEQTADTNPFGSPSFPLYPPINFPPGGSAMPAMPIVQRKEINFLHGVPFKLSKDLTPGSNNEIVAMQLSEVMAYCTQRLGLNSTEYDFSVERSVLAEN